MYWLRFFIYIYIYIYIFKICTFLEGETNSRNTRKLLRVLIRVAQVDKGKLESLRNCEFDFQRAFRTAYLGHIHESNPYAPCRYNKYKI